MQSLPAFVGVKIFWINQLHPHFLRERLGAFAVEHDVRRFFHDQSRETDRVADMLHARDRAGLKRLAVHDRRIEFVRSFVRKDGAFAGVEKRVVLEHLDRGLDRIETRAASLEHVVARLQRLLESGAMRCFVFRRHLTALDRAGAAVDHHAEFHWFVFLLCA